MHGLIFVTWEKYLAERFGAPFLKTYREAIAETPARSPLASRLYDDATMSAGIGAVSSLSGLAADTLLREYGRYFIINGLTGHLCQAVLAEVHSASELLAAMRDVHARLRQTHEGVTPPLFTYEAPARPHHVRLIYDSERRLCSLLWGAIEGAAERYSERVRIIERSCMKKGARVCRIEAQFSGPLVDEYPQQKTWEQRVREEEQRELRRLVLASLPGYGTVEGATIGDLQDLLQRRGGVDVHQLRPAATPICRTREKQRKPTGGRFRASTLLALSPLSHGNALRSVRACRDAHVDVTLLNAGLQAWQGREIQQARIGVHASLLRENPVVTRAVEFLVTCLSLNQASQMGTGGREGNASFTAMFTQHSHCDGQWQIGDASDQCAGQDPLYLLRRERGWSDQWGGRRGYLVRLHAQSEVVKQGLLRCSPSLAESRSRTQRRRKNTLAPVSLLSKSWLQSRAMAGEKRDLALFPFSLHPTVVCPREQMPFRNVHLHLKHDQAFGLQRREDLRVVPDG